MQALLPTDPAVDTLWQQELQRQQQELELIASENYVSPAVLAALGSIFTNKYSEGYPGKRYYAGNQYIDELEDLAITRARQLFGGEHINVQPLSGSPANLAVYLALLQPGDTILGFSLDQGGHLSHGHPLNFSGKMYQIEAYGVRRDTERLDMDEVRALAHRTKPKLIMAGFSAYSRDFDWPAFRTIADEVGAYAVADIAHIAGLIAAGVLANPVPTFDVVTTTTHKTLRGPRGAMIFCRDALAKEIDRAVFPGVQGGPHDNVTAAKAVALGEAAAPAFKTYAHQVIKNAQVLAQALTEHGFRIVSGGTDNHLLLVDLTPRQITGKEAELALQQAGISCNKNLIPYDTRKALDPSGIRLGTAAVTTRGMSEVDMLKIADWISEALTERQAPATLAKIKAEIRTFSAGYPLP